MFMRKVLFLMFVIMVLLVGCGGVDETSEGLELPEQEEPVAEQPQEVTQPEGPSCSDECTSDTCSGCKYYECVMQDDGCKDKIAKGIVEGKCGAECFFNSDCGDGQECVSYKCKTKTSVLDLEDLPEPFLKDTFIVLGADGTSTDVMAAVEIATMLQHESGKEAPTKLDNEIAGQESSYNLVVIGSPCDNLVIETVFGIECDGLKIDEGKALIKLASNGDKAAMLITAKSPSDILRAAKQVANYESYSLEGTEVIV